MDRTIRAGTFLLLGLAILLGVWAAVPKPRPADPLPSPTALPSDEDAPPEAFRPASSPSYDPPSSAVALHPKTGRYVAAWMPTDWDTADARASFEANLDILDEVSPIWYEMRRDGTLTVLGGARDETLLQMAHEADILVLPCLTNGFDPDRTGYTLGNPERRSKFVQRILDEVEEYGYDGIDIDFEAVPAEERDEFTAFIRELAAGLHEKGRLLSVAIHARTGEKGGAPGAQAQDWAALGQSVDRFRIMTYDYHWRGGGPGPIAPIYWVQEVVEYARTQVDPAKIELGIPFYGYDWVGDTGSGVRWSGIQELLDTYRPKVNLMEWDGNGEVAESWFTYRNRDGLHTVWFASRRSLEAKLELLVRYDLAGIAIWRLGGEDPAYWETIRKILARDPYEVQRSVLRYLPEP